MKPLILRKILLIGLFLFSTILSAAHHHSDLKPHYDCPICIFQINETTEEPDFNPIKIVIPEEAAFDYLINYKNPSKTVVLIANQRAPPVLYQYS